jgi:tetratricopeptide (TPR) repeat protein
VQIDLKKNGDALETLALARKKFPNTFVGEYFTGVACGRLKDWSEAVRHFTEAEVIAKAGDSKQLDYQFYFQIAAAAERSHQIPQAVEYFETCLKLKPNFTEAMNYLGYMWAERGENLDHARDLIEKAVKAEPTNAAFLDSLGWVLFKQGKNAEALPWLIKARDLSDEPDATVCEHVGDVYLALGRKDKAREAFEKSLAIESNNDVKKKLDQLVAGPP